MDPSEIDSSDPFSGIDSYGEHETPLALMYNSEDAEYPSARLGNKLIIPLFVGFIVLSAFVVLLLIIWNNRRSMAQLQKVKDQETKLKNQAEKSLIRQASDESSRDDTSMVSQFTEDAAEAADVEAGLRGRAKQHEERPPLSPKNATNRKAESCMLCSEPLQIMAPISDIAVYESNNPQCGHRFHKPCMDKWLEFQNTCPTCNKPFLIASHTSGS